MFVPFVCVADLSVKSSTTPVVWPDVSVCRLVWSEFVGSEICADEVILKAGIVPTLDE
jgi:hypothetical protein